MSHADSAIGMMDGAYFTSRNDILAFFNDLLDLNLTKIEQTASGAVACQLTEYLFPGSIPMSKVNWGARTQPEFIDNYKLLQKAFNKHKIQRYVEVDKLIRAKYQDNLEFCQWLKAFFDQTAPAMRGGREGYDPAAVRAKGKGGKTCALNRRGARRAGGAGARSGGPTRTVGGARAGTTAAARPARPKPAAPQPVAAVSRPAAPGGSRPNSGGSSSSRVSAAKENNANSRAPAPPLRKAPSSAAAASSANSAKVARLEEECRSLKSANSALESKHAELERAAAEIEATLQTVESERDFYFEKLRGIEVMLQVYREREDEKRGSGDVEQVMERVFKVMYATMEDDVVVDDEGNLVGDVALESSVEQRAQDDQQEDLLVDEEAFLPTSSEVGPDAPEELPANQFCSDSSDLDDDELLTSGLDDGPPVAKAADPAGREGGGAFGDCSAAIHDDDDDFSDEDLLTD